jgi:UDP-N-acetylmuramyl pentapeptide synthase
MRGEIVDVAGRHVIVDCYNANPVSMAAGLAALVERRGNRSDVTALAVLGDMLELGDHAAGAHRDMGALAAANDVGVIALGTYARDMIALAGSAAELADDPRAAATRALARTKPGDWILLKASRGMKLERVLVAMRELAAGGSA